MNIDNYDISVLRFAANNVERSSIAQVALTETIAEGIVRQVGIYDLSLSRAFTSVTDPQLLLAIQERLESIPE
jgi:hypothetical protein